MSYHKEVQRTQGNIPDSVKKLLPRLRSAETEVIIVTLPEATPVYEALRLEEDLNRANIATKSWLVNSSLYHTKATNGNFALIAWSADDIRDDKLREL